MRRERWEMSKLKEAEVITILSKAKFLEERGFKQMPIGEYVIAFSNGAVNVEIVSEYFGDPSDVGIRFWEGNRFYRLSRVATKKHKFARAINLHDNGVTDILRLLRFFEMNYAELIKEDNLKEY